MSAFSGSEPLVNIVDTFLHSVEGLLEQFRVLASTTAKDSDATRHNVMFQEQCTMSFREVIALIGALRRDFFVLSDKGKSITSMEHCGGSHPTVVESFRSASDPPLFPETSVFDTYSMQSATTVGTTATSQSQRPARTFHIEDISAHSSLFPLEPIPPVDNLLNRQTGRCVEAAQWSFLEFNPQLRQSLLRDLASGGASQEKSFLPAPAVVRPTLLTSQSPLHERVHEIFALYFTPLPFEDSRRPGGVHSPPPNIPDPPTSATLSNRRSSFSQLQSVGEMSFISNPITSVL